MPNIGVIGLHEKNKKFFRKLIPTWDGKTVWSLKHAIVKLFESKSYKDRIVVTVYLGSYAIDALGEEPEDSDQPFLWVTCSTKNPLPEIMEVLHQSTHFRVRGSYIEKSLAPRPFPKEE